MHSALRDEALRTVDVKISIGHCNHFERIQTNPFCSRQPSIVPQYVVGSLIDGALIKGQTCDEYGFFEIDNRKSSRVWIGKRAVRHLQQHPLYIAFHNKRNVGLSFQHAICQLHVPRRLGTWRNITWYLGSNSKGFRQVFQFDSSESFSVGTLVSLILPKLSWDLIALILEFYF